MGGVHLSRQPGAGCFFANGAPIANCVDIVSEIYGGVRSVLGHERSFPGGYRLGVQAPAVQVHGVTPAMPTVGDEDTRDVTGRGLAWWALAAPVAAATLAHNV